MSDDAYPIFTGETLELMVDPTTGERVPVLIIAAWVDIEGERYGTQLELSPDVADNAAACDLAREHVARMVRDAIYDATGQPRPKP